MKIIGFVAALILVGWGSTNAAHAYSVESLKTAGGAANRIDVAILGDGYRTQDQSKLTTDAQTVLNHLFDVTPYKEYANLFNVKLVHVVSNQNGADNGSFGAVRDTALGAYFNCNGIDRLICINTSTTFQVAAEHVPEYDLIVVLVNDPKYGGAGGSIARLSTHASAPEILVHELGHSLSGLADEYETPYPSYPACSTSNDCSEPNATLRTSRNAIKWNDWISSSTPVPTPDTIQSGIGLYEGCRYQSAGVFRPAFDCKMRHLDVEFCSVCREGSIRSYWNRVSPIDSTSPVKTATLQSCDENVFSVTSPDLAPSNWSRIWTIDGTPVLGDQTLVVAPDAFAPGAHTVQVVVQDGTTLVRNDPDNLLREVYTWNVQVNACGTGGTPRIAQDFSKAAQGKQFKRIAGGTFKVNQGAYALTQPSTAATTHNANIAVHGTVIAGDFVFTVQASATATTGANDGLSIIFGFKTAKNYFFANFHETSGPDTNGLFKVTSGNTVKLASFSDVIVGGAIHTIEVRKYGGTLTVSRDGTQVASVSATVPNAKVGVGSKDDGARFDDFIVY